MRDYLINSVLFLVASLIPCLVLAEVGPFAGAWSGKASLWQDGKKISDCSRAILEFRQDSETLETVMGEFNCSPMVIRSKPKKVAIRNGFLYFNETLVGVIGDQDIFSSYWDSKAGWNHQFRLRVENVPSGSSNLKVVKYFEMVTLSNGFEYYRIEGTLEGQSR